MDVISSTQYLQSRQLFYKSNTILDFYLQVYKTTRLKQFRKFACIEPEGIDVFVQSLENENIFYNNFANSYSQILINKQVLMAFIWFESYGNSASVDKIVFLYGVSYSTIRFVIWQVISAIQSSSLHCQHFQWPIGQEKEAAKNLIESQAGFSVW